MTEEQRIAELMKPRYRVLIDYPDSPFKIGFVINIAKEYPKDRFDWANDWYAKYRDVFKRLEWWEDRKPEEMPEYVKQEYDSDYDYDGEGYLPEVYKSGVEFNYMYSNESHLHIASFKTGGGCSLSYLLPATLAEYLQYINSKPQP